MAKVNFISIIKDASCRMDDVVFSKWKNTCYMKRYRRHEGPLTPKQQEVRNAFGKLVSAWKQVGGILHQSWEESAEGQNMTGYNLFIGANSGKQRAGEPIEFFRPLNDPSLFEITAAPGSAPGEIRVSFAPVNSGHHVTLFNQKRTSGVADGTIARVDGGANPAGPLVLSGLETGAEYFVYGVITDAAYPSASTVSRSHGVICAAS